MSNIEWRMSNIEGSVSSFSIRHSLFDIRNFFSSHTPIPQLCYRNSLSYQIRLMCGSMGVWACGRRRNYECRTTNVEWRRNGQNLRYSTFAIRYSTFNPLPNPQPPKPPHFLKQQLRNRIWYERRFGKSVRRRARGIFGPAPDDF